ncbi:MAG: hypothetical protein ACUVV5_04960 [Candidatus Aminicenantales bacterium]
MLIAIKEIGLKPNDFFYCSTHFGLRKIRKIDPILQADPLFKELRKLLRSKGFTLMDSALIQAVDKKFPNIIIDDAAQFSLLLREKGVKGQTPEMIQTDILLRRIKEEKNRGPNVSPEVIWMNMKRDLLSSNLNPKSGERSVVGVSRLDGGEEGFILIISGKVVD